MLSLLTLVTVTCDSDDCDYSMVVPCQGPYRLVTSSRGVVTEFAEFWTGRLHHVCLRESGRDSVEIECCRMQCVFYY